MVCVGEGRGGGSESRGRGCTWDLVCVYVSTFIGIIVLPGSRPP